MPPPRKSSDPLEALIDHLAEAIAAKIGSAKRAVSSKKGAAKRKRNFSPEGIERIRAAARKRWAKFHKARGASK